MTKVGIKCLLISYFLPESLLLASARISLFVSFIFIAVVNLFDPSLNLIFFAILAHIY